MNITLNETELDQFYKKLEEWSTNLELYIGANFIKKYEECIGRVRTRVSDDPDLVFKFAYNVINYRLDQIDMIICKIVHSDLMLEYKKLNPIPKII